jgi:hypothetical protein
VIPGRPGDRPPDRPWPLPVCVRPVAEEGAESYVRRLARANHLKPSYLRRYLATPRGSYGPIRPDQLALLTGRTLPAVLHALPDLTERPHPQRRHTRQHDEDEKRRNQARKRALFAAIRRDAAVGLSKRAIERKHHVGRRTIVKALVWANPPARKKINRPSVVLQGLHHHIDALIQKNPTVAVNEVWEHLVDDHDATVSYGAVRAYVAKQRPELLHPAHASAEPPHQLDRPWPTMQEGAGL